MTLDVGDDIGKISVGWAYTYRARVLVLTTTQTTNKKPPTMTQLVLFNKPFGVISQFSDDGSGHPTLKHWIDIANVYPAGRLDHHSEGLLLLTDDGALQHRISHPSKKLAKTYWIQVEGQPDSDGIEHLQRGIQLKDGPTLPAIAHHIETPDLWHRALPPKYAAAVPTSWLSITITEGRNRQVRRMSAYVGHPTVRLVRTQVGPWTVDGIEQGDYRILSGKQAWQDLSSHS